MDLCFLLLILSNNAQQIVLLTIMPDRTKPSQQICILDNPFPLFKSWSCLLKDCTYIEIKYRVLKRGNIHSISLKIRSKYHIEIFNISPKCQDSSIQNNHATATGCSDLLSNIISHDSFTRMLSHNECASQYLWNKTKDFVREHEHNHGILSLDNSILHKPHTKVNEVITWHYDHGVGKVVKGINLLSAMVDYGKVSIPVAYDVMVKDQICIKKDKNNKEVMARKSRYSINEMARKLVNQTVINRVKFEYITGDSWFSSKENIRFFNNNKHKFVLAISNNRLVASSRQSLRCGNHVKRT